MCICVRETREEREREGEGEGERRKKKGGKGLKTGEGERKYMTTKHRCHSSYVNFILLTVSLRWQEPFI